MSNKDQGLYHKYHVQKIVGYDLLEVDDWVFVLNPRTDPIAAHALAHYARLAKSRGYEHLADDIWDRLDELDVWLGPHDE